MEFPCSLSSRNIIRLYDRPLIVNSQLMHRCDMCSDCRFTLMISVKFVRFTIQSDTTTVCSAWNQQCGHMRETSGEIWRH